MLSEFKHLNYLLNVIRMIKSREIIRTDNLTGMGKDGNN
jgi:hypothetical protein